MRWKQGRQSSNVEDRRGLKISKGAAGLGLGAIVAMVVASFLGLDPKLIMGFLEAGGGGQGGGAEQHETIDPNNDPEAEQKAFVSTVLAYTEDVWDDEFRRNGRSYERPNLVMFRDRVNSACGQQSSAVGPFYCGGDKQIYLDLGFFDQLAGQLKAGGDFAQAYVIAHEVGHHIQTLLGTSPQVHRQQRGLPKVEANKLSVRLELQADFYAGVWAHYAQKLGLLERGDLEEAMNAAKRIGDDALQRQATGTVRPDSFTHGTSAQRKRWFNLGFETGDMRQAALAFEYTYEQL